MDWLRLQRTELDIRQNFLIIPLERGGLKPFFFGQSHYSNDVPFDASLLVRFRERINVNLVNQINQRMVKKIQEGAEEESKKKAQILKRKKQERHQIKVN